MKHQGISGATSAKSSPAQPIYVLGIPGIVTSDEIPTCCVRVCVHPKSELITSVYNPESMFDTFSKAIVGWSKKPF
jgi:hypothetical protein